MKKNIVAVLVVIAATGIWAQAAETSSLPSVLKRQLALKEQNENYRQEVDQATRILSTKRIGLYQALELLRPSSSGSSGRPIEGLYKEKTQKESEITRLKTELELLNLKIEVAQISDGAAREAKAKLIEAELAKVQQQEKQAKDLIEPKYADLHMAMENMGPEMEAALRPCFKSTADAAVGRIIETRIIG